MERMRRGLRGCGYANRNLILAMENKKLMEENYGLKKVLRIFEERVIENG